MESENRGIPTNDILRTTPEKSRRANSVQLPERIAQGAEPYSLRFRAFWVVALRNTRPHPRNSSNFPFMRAAPQPVK
jgi:hypothetical protein